MLCSKNQNKARLLPLSSKWLSPLSFNVILKAAAHSIRKEKNRNVKIVLIQRHDGLCKKS